MLARSRFAVERTDRLGRTLEPRVGGIDDRLGHDRYHALLDPLAAQLVVQSLADLIPDRALGIGATTVQWHLVQHLLGKLGAQQDEADLGTVTVCNDDTVPLGNDIGDAITGLATGPVLIENRRVLGILDQGVSTNCNDHQLLHGSPHS